MAPSDSLTLKTLYLDAKIVILSALVQKLWSKTSFCIMMANITCACMSYIQTAHDIFNLLKGPDLSYFVKFGNILPVNNSVVAQNEIQ